MDRGAITARIRRGIDGSVLKWIAIIAMVVDHTAVQLIERVFIVRGSAEISDSASLAAFVQQNEFLYGLYMIMRYGIGRIAFPIFCFLLVQGFMHTHNLKKYIGRMLIFALISEIPFDIAISATILGFNYQNVFFTLLIGLLVITGFRFIEQKKDWNKWLKILLYVIFTAAGAMLGIVLRTDYGMFGVLTIVAMYLFKEKNTTAGFVGCAVLILTNLGELTALLSVILIYFYNGERGKGNKWVFYFFYPVHMFILYLIALILGMGGIAVIPG